VIATEKFPLDILAPSLYINLDGSTKNTIEFDKTALNALALFQAAAPASFFEQQRQLANLPPEKGVYTAAVVVALMIMQRLVQGKGTLSGAVQQLLSGALGELLPGHKRVQEDTVSSNTGAYSRARQRLPPAVAEGVSDRVAEYLLADRKEALPGLGRQAFLLDGSSINLAHTEEILAVYPAASNQYGDSHWPVMRVAVAHDLVSGIAMRPAYGPMYGDEAVSEQALAEQIINRLAGGSILVLDRNFGTFAVSWHAHRRKHDFVVRLTDARARSLLNGNLPQQADQWVEWIPSRWDRKAHPHLPADACLRVRFLSTQVVHKGKRIQLYLLTTLDLDREQIVQLYGFRWHIGVSRQGHIVQPVRDRPRPTDSGLVAWEAPWRESKTAKPSDNMLRKECARRTRLQCDVNADVASLHEIPVAETVDNVRKQKELAETSPMRRFSPAGYQRRHGVKDDVETGEALGVRRRNPVEEMLAITVSGKCWHRHQGGGSGCSTDDGRAAKRARREGPGPVSNSVRQGEAGVR